MGTSHSISSNRRRRSELIDKRIDQEMPSLLQVKKTAKVFHVSSGILQKIDRGLSYAPYADLIWMETSN
jgi:isocitrate lyase